jgi:NAD+ synthase (glutamine-hydrolysing)
VPVLLVGAPLRFEGKLFNCGVVVHRGRVLGIAPKSYLPNYREFYEKRSSRPPRRGAAARSAARPDGARSATTWSSRREDLPGFALHVEICEDLWAPVPPSTYAALAGATVLANLSASNITIGKAAYRRTCAPPSRGSASPPTCTRPRARRVDHRPGLGRARADLREQRAAGRVRALRAEEHLIAADVDLERLAQDRMRMTTFNDAAGDHPAGAGACAGAFELEVPGGARSRCGGGGALPLRPRGRRSGTSAATRRTTSRCTA